MRFRPDRFVGTPFPKEEPAAENPPFGAVIDYVLASPPGAAITLTIRDAAGGEVRRYSSADAPPRLDLEKLGSAPEWVQEPVRLAATPGPHRFVWPLRYPAPPALSRGNAFADGIWAPPGRYSVELRVEGRSFTQPLEVVADPRVSLPPSAYADQFELARRIESARARIAAASGSARRLQAAVAARRAAADPVSAALLDEFQQRLTEVLGVVPTTNPSNAWWRPPTTLSSLRYISNTLDALQEAVDGTDAAPSPDAREGVARTEALIAPTLAKWEALEGDGLNELNSALLRAGEPAVSLTAEER